MEKYYTLTENGAIQFNTTGNSCLDLFASIGSCREMAMNNPDILLKKFYEAFAVNPICAVSIVFWARAIREGAGERKVFEVIIEDLCKTQPQFIIDNLEAIVEFGRWKDLAYVYEIGNGEIKNKIAYFWASQIATSSIFGNIHSNDFKMPNALACKWLPKGTDLYKDVQNRLNYTNKRMRQYIARYSNTVEQKMCAKNWKEINYSKIPSQALNLYKDAFLRNDKDHYLNDITTKRINAGAIYPHEILWNYAKCYRYGGNNTELNETVEALWKALPNFINKDMRFITICDCSCSMTSSVGKFNALSIARALSIYCSEKLEGSWKDKAILFSSEPQFIDCSQCKTLAEKNDEYKKFDDYSSTNLEAVFDLILEAAKNCKDKTTIPTTILVLSDMQMNENYGARDVSFMEAMRAKYKLAGVDFPSVIWWNLCETNTGFVDSKYDNVAFASGFNPKIMQAVFNGMKVEYDAEGNKKVKIDPMVVMNKALNIIVKTLKFKNIKPIPEIIKDIQLNTTIGQSIREDSINVNNDTFLDCIANIK